MGTGFSGGHENVLEFNRLIVVQTSEHTKMLNCTFSKGELHRQTLRIHIKRGGEMTDRC